MDQLIIEFPHPERNNPNWAKGGGWGNKDHGLKSPIESLS